MMVIQPSDDLEIAMIDHFYATLIMDAGLLATILIGWHLRRVLVYEAANYGLMIIIIVEWVYPAPAAPMISLPFAIFQSVVGAIAVSSMGAIIFILARVFECVLHIRRDYFSPLLAVATWLVLVDLRDDLVQFSWQGWILWSLLVGFVASYVALYGSMAYVRRFCPSS